MNLRHAAEYAGYRAGSATLRSLPLGFAQRLAAGAARALFDRGGKRIDWVLTNLRLAFPDLPDSELRQIGRESYVHFGWNVVDFARSELWSRDEIRAHVSFEGVHHLETALKAGRGAIALSLHLGNFELGNLALPLVGVPVVAVGRPMANRLLYAQVVRQRSRTGTPVIDRRHAARSILRALRDGSTVGILNDQYSRRTRGVFVPLFGIRCSTSAGAATIALRSRAPIVPMHIFRDAPDHHRFCIDAPLELPRSGDRTADILETTARMNRALERSIRAHPEQYMWGHRRFRHSPDLPNNPYE
ncbi:MAG: lysophospholipid acyltransferase family protein [Myxococcota bacterium]